MTTNSTRVEAIVQRLYDKAIIKDALEGKVYSFNQKLASRIIASEIKQLTAVAAAMRGALGNDLKDLKAGNVGDQFRITIAETEKAIAAYDKLVGGT